MTRWVPVAVAGVVVAAGLAATADIDHERPLLFRDNFDGRDRVITNQYAYYSPDVPGRAPLAKWEVQSGCALRTGNQLWTGVPTENLPNRDCSDGSGSSVFRMWTKRADFEDVAVSFDLRPQPLHAGR